MGDKSGIDWTDSTWYYVTTEGRWKTYRRKTTDRPGTRERRRQAARGFRWCRGCRAWLTADLVLRQGICQPHANEEYRATYAGEGGKAIRAQKYARSRHLRPTPVWWWDEQLAEFSGLCAYGCGRQAQTADHVRPVALGGRSEPSNLVPCCRSCNSRKGHRDPATWISRGVAAFPEQWESIIALAHAHGPGWEEVA